MTTLPNLSCLHVSNRASPTSGTGGGPGGGGAAARDVHGQDDLLSLVAEHLRRLEPEAVPQAQRVWCVATLSGIVGQGISGLSFAVLFSHGDRPTLSKDALTQGFKQALLGAIESVLEDPWNRDLATKTAFEDKIECIARRFSMGKQEYSLNLSLSSRIEDEQLAHKVLRRLIGEGGPWENTNDYETFFNALLDGVLQTVHMSPLKNSYAVITNVDPSTNRLYVRVVEFYAVYDEDIPRTLPNEANAPDDRTKKLLKRLRALKASERARAAAGQN